MTGPVRGNAGSGSLTRLRRRLTTWYALTFLAVLTLLGVAVFAVITGQFDRELDASLAADGHELARVTASRAAATNRPSSYDPSRDIRIPGREMFVLDTSGRPLARSSNVPDWLGELARDAWRRGTPAAAQHQTESKILRAYAEPLRSNGTTAVAVAVADEVELEDRYTPLIIGFAGASLVALLIVAGGGWIIARQAAEPIERAIDNMRRFMADAAHELRTPVTAIRSRAEVAAQRPRSPEEYVRALGAIEAESARLGRIVEDLLTLARADARERPIEPRRLFLDDVALDAADAARAMADKKGVRMEVGDFEEAPVLGDASLLRQLIMILLDNAIKFTPTGGRVRVDVQRSGPAASVIVSDTGIGITGEQLPHIFDRFYRGDPSRTRDPEGDGRERGGSEGVGLGLSIARWIVDEHKGSIAVDSEPARGTSIAVTVPADDNGLSSS
ncbi:MAG TPA: HAMP domain-containing sensor histidine kinase [Gemmatimonadaceae bacterium]